MKKLLLLHFFLLMAGSVLLAQPQPKRELRGAWVATYFSIDWPNRNATPQSQRDAFITLLNHHQATGITTMYVQVRSQSDAMYKSDIEPWAFYLTPLKVGGNAPLEDWDPMQFMIEECHARGIEFHAWLNPYRAIGNIGNSTYFSPNHIYNRHPEWMIANGSERILNPGLPQVREHINNVVMEIVNNYDVDGIHFDDYFYPNIATINDDAAYNADPRGFTSRADWRRDNVNLLVQSVSAGIKQAKPWVEFGISPSGIWRNGGEGSATSGLQHYVSLYADSRKWLQEAWIDYLCPQVYWYIGQPGADYSVLIPWWNNNAYGRHIYIGMAGYKVGVAGNGTFTTDRTMIPRELRMNRNSLYPNVKGQAIYNTTSLRNNNLNFRDSIRLHFYHQKALQPSMPWIDAVPPLPATALSASYNGSVTLSWTNPPEAGNEMDKVKQLVIYRSETPGINLEDPANILTITPGVQNSFTDLQAAAGKVYYYRVTTLDRLHNEAAPTNEVMVCTSVPQILTWSQVFTSCATTGGTYTIAPVTTASNCTPLTISYNITGATNRSGSGADASGAFGEGQSTIDWTVTDAAGNQSHAQTLVTIYANPVLTIPDAYTLPSGVLPNTVYKGYEPAGSITLQGLVSGGLAPYSYQWTGGSTDALVMLSPTHTTSYSLVVTDDSGCQATANKTVSVINVTAGKNNNKVSICHKASHSHTIEISKADVADHLAHGDMLAACTENIITMAQVPALQELSESRPFEVTAYPNPSASYFTLKVTGSTANSWQLKVTDMLGRVMENRRGLQQVNGLRLAANYPAGTYYIEIGDGRQTTTLKLVKQ